MKRVVGYKVEVEVYPAEPMLSETTDEKMLKRAFEAAEEFCANAERHIDNVNPLHYRNRFETKYQTVIVPVYEDEEAE